MKSNMSDGIMTKRETISPLLCDLIFHLRQRKGHQEYEQPIMRKN